MKINILYLDKTHNLLLLLLLLLLFQHKIYHETACTSLREDENLDARNMSKKI